MQKFIAGLGRIFLGSLFFLLAAYSILNWDGVLSSLQTHLSFYLTPLIPNISSILVSWSTLLLGLATLFGMIGSICLMFGYGVRFGAFLLILVLLPSTLVFHHFWTYQGEAFEVHLAMFMMNLSIFGGLLLALAYGGKRHKGTSNSHV